MKTTITTILLLASSVGLCGASKYNHTFSSQSLARALSAFSKEHPEVRVNFIFDELENYKTNVKTDSDDPEQALRAIIGMNPVTLLKKNNMFFIEALQHGRHTYTGKAIGSDTRPVEAATVMLLSPKDSTVLTYGFTSESGSFSIPCDRDKVIVKLTSLGYAPKSFTSPGFELGTIIMQESAVRLKDIKVNGDAALLYSDKNVYVPTSRQKNASKDATDLLLRMAIPQVSVSPTNGVSTPSGEEIKIFINSVEATPEDIFGLKTSDVKRVEYLDFPTDAKFMGAPHAVNIVVQEYEFGGYSKFGENAYLNDDIYSATSAYSKFVYRKMTYDLYGNIGYADYTIGGKDTRGIYRFPTGELERIHTQTRFINRYITMPLTFRASYSGKSSFISHSFGYTLDKPLKFVDEGRLRFNTENPQEYKAASSSLSKTHSFSLKGNYYFSLPNDWNLSMTPVFNYGHTDSHSFYETDIPSDVQIVNDADEDVYYARMDANAAKRIGEYHTIQIMGNGGTTIDKVRYTGNSPYDAEFSNSFFAIPIGYSFSREKFRLNVDVGICEEFIRTNGERYNDLYPFIHLSGNYTFNTKNQTSIWLQYATNSPGLQHRSPNVLQSNEFIYRTGNPDIKNSRHITVNISHAFYPNNAISILPYMKFYTDLDRRMGVYEFYKELYDKTGREALLRTFINNGNYTRMDIGGSLTLRLLDRNLILQASPQLSHIVSTGRYHRNRTPLEVDFYGQYYFGNFNVAATYLGKGHHVLSSDYAILSDTPCYYKMSCGWADKGFVAELQWWNFANYGHSGSTSEFSSPLLSSESRSISASFSSKIQIYVSYTFGYGKKVTRGNEVGASGTTSSAIL